MTRVEIRVTTNDNTPDVTIDVDSDGMPVTLATPQTAIVSELLDHAVAAVRRTYGI